MLLADGAPTVGWGKLLIVLYLTVLHGIALLASAPGLYLARHLSTLGLSIYYVIRNRGGGVFPIYYKIT